LNSTKTKADKTAKKFRNSIDTGSSFDVDVYNIATDAAVA